MNKSLWSDITDLPNFEELKEDIKTDVLIIGGGLCGILCAHLLSEAGVDCVLTEANRIASGTTKNTTAKITFGHGLIYSKLIKDFGKEKALMYLNANKDALLQYEKLCADINSGFETKSSYTYSTLNRWKIEDEIRAVQSLGFPAEFSDCSELPFKTVGGICYKNQAQFNPLELIKKLAKNLKIYENTFIREIKSHCAISDKAKITAKKIIVATHFPFINKHGSYFLKLYQHRSYVSAFENSPNLKGMYVDEDLKGLSLSFHNNLLILGGGSHRTGKYGENWQAITRLTEKHYPTAQLKYTWSTQDCMSLDNVPYIGNYSKNTPDLYVATGFNKWGMTSSMVAAKILCDMITEKKSKYHEIFAPDRNILKPQLFVNGLESAKNLLTPTAPRCPHLGCALKWNNTEHSWDCPCHGSRFEKNGTLINGPSIKNLR